MRFKSLHMENFRGTRELDITFEPDMTVIIGRNGSGKTSILDALVIVVDVVRFHLAGPRRGGLIDRYSPLDVLEGTESFVLKLTYEIKNPESQSWDSDSLDFTGFRDQPVQMIHQYVDGLAQWTKTIGFLPRFIRYRQERGFQSARPHRSSEGVRNVLDPDAVQDSSLEEDTRAVDDFEAWWERRDAQEARRVRDGERDYRDPQLEAIRSTIARIDGFSGLTYNSAEPPSGLRFIKSDGTPVHVRSLSSGERCYMILLADLVRRRQVFAPGKPLEEIPAVVLIDEIELNLHPAWQSEIVPMLAHVFKACQFIVTTHSPQVLSGVEREKVRMIEEDVPGWSWKVTVPLSTRGRTSNYILEGVFGASERYPPIDALIDEFNDAIDEDDAEAAEILAKLENEIGDDTPTLLVLRKRLRKLRGGA